MKRRKMTEPVSEEQNNKHPSKHEAELAYEWLIKLRDTDLHLLWARASFFLLMESALLGFAISNLDKDPVILLIEGYGLIIAFIWVVITHMGCDWLRSWKKDLESIEAQVLPDTILIFRKREGRKRIKTSFKSIFRMIPYLYMILWFLFLSYSFLRRSGFFK